MSFRHATRPQDLGPARLKPAQGAHNLDPSVEAEGRATDLCTGPAPDEVVRARLLAWLAEGVREVSWALCSLPRERWAAAPPASLGDWAALRHIRHLALREAHQLLPAVTRVLGELGEEEGTAALSSVELDEADAAWDPATAGDSSEAILRQFADTRFELLHRLESAPDAAWVDSPEPLDWLLLSARQHELQHLATIWRLALSWDRVSPEKRPIHGVPLHPADRLEESH
jgi:hypothetical protein